jgi:hypothetical protein
MKSIYAGRSPLFHTTTMAHVSGHHRCFDDLKERALGAVTMLAVVVAIVALNVAMSVAVYRWSRSAPIFRPQAAGPPIVEPWSE